MLFLPGWLFSAITFPGVIVHEIAHRLFCHLTGVPVYEVSYFRFRGNPAGYVVHGPPPTLRSALLISAGPLIVNSLLCMLLTFAAVIPLIILDDSDVSAVSIFLFWIGISIGMHAFPSNHDAEAFVLHAEERRGASSIVATLAQLFAWLLKAVNALRIVWIDLFYAVALSMLLPFAFGLG
ncbi:metalloprotease family protein [Sphingomonas sp. S2-65]|uniref:metalloprotease family protein n=1 Tax=Sphingomonas sp. S2-65 TaxID=2903960 RepID=UPI001F226225|nr:metalloprotease family protein [Sphingomonas sp. S2-65]UYY57749.1 metalloprotease family protein [Sphingomonas sp. S2-65]